MAGVDFQKAYDMVPHSRILETLELVGTATNIINSFFSGQSRLGKVIIRRDIFQGDSLSPLLFAVPLIAVTIIRRTLKQRYSFGKGNERLDHLLFMDNLRLYSSNGIENDSLLKVVKIIGMQFGFDK